MLRATLSNHEYTFFKGHQKDDKYRSAFNELAIKTYGLSFENWYQSGYWNEKYIPYTLFDEEKAVANVSINIMNFDILGKQQRYIQIGTVMTDEGYRNKGLNRFLLEKVLDDWMSKSDLIYLFANETVLDFYPKFGFRRAREYTYTKAIQKSTENKSFEKLNMDLQLNRDRLYDYARNSESFAKIAMKENADLVLFYCTEPMKDNIYYIKSIDVIVVAEFEGNQLHLLDVFGKVYVELDIIIDSLASGNINKVLLGFTPANCHSYELVEKLDDDYLFIQDGKTNLFDDQKVMFPLLSHA
jgi:predicted GNAT family N-acyltransferase